MEREGEGDEGQERRERRGRTYIPQVLVEYTRMHVVESTQSAFVRKKLSYPSVNIYEYLQKIINSNKT